MDLLPGRHNRSRRLPPLPHSLSSINEISEAVSSPQSNTALRSHVSSKKPIVDHSRDWENWFDIHLTTTIAPDDKFSVLIGGIKNTKMMEFFLKNEDISVSNRTEVISPEKTESKIKPILHDNIINNIKTNNQEYHISGAKLKPIIICFHGCGHTSMSWANVAKLISQEVIVIAFDMRGHGRTVCQEGMDLSINRLVDDGVSVILSLLRQMFIGEGEAGASMNLPAIGISGVILVGHSLGGSVACRIASRGVIPHLLGLVVIDVVEGTALDALPLMETFVNKLPMDFGSTEEAINWSIASNTLMNRTSAACSIPSQLIHDPDLGRWGWIIDIRQTKEYWKEWFLGLSSDFLSVKSHKLLVLTRRETLDKELLIGQMQGKFQVQVVPLSGHVIMEDQPEKISETILEFLHHYMLFNRQKNTPKIVKT